MEIRIDPHTAGRAEERGATKDEIQDVIENGFTIPAKHGRFGKAKMGALACRFHTTINRTFFI